MPFARFAARTMPILLAGSLVAPAYGQPAPAAPAPPAPPAWTVTADAAVGSVRIAARGKDGTVLLVGTCTASQLGISGLLSDYRGNGLRTDGQVEAVSFFAQGADWRDAFSVRLRYVASNRNWVLAGPLSPVFLASFSRGATLSVVNGRGQEVAVFDLTGSTAAARAMRSTCGFH